jgi:hypothetical protein
VKQEEEKEEAAEGSICLTGNVGGHGSGIRCGTMSGSSPMSASAAHTYIHTAHPTDRVPTTARQYRQHRQQAQQTHHSAQAVRSSSFF